MILPIALLACAVEPPLALSVAIRASSVVVDLTGPPGATVALHGRSVTLDGQGQGSVSLSTALFPPGEARLSALVEGAREPVTRALTIDHAPLLAPQGCETLEPDQRGGRVSLEGRPGQELPCDFDRRGVVRVFYPPSPGAALVVDGREVPDPEAGSRVVELPLGALLQDVPLADDGLPQGEGYALDATWPARLTVQGLTLEQPLRVTAPRSATPELLLATFKGVAQGVAPGPGGAGGVACVVHDADGERVELVGPPSRLGELRAVAVGIPGERRPAGTCGPYRDDAGRGPGVVAREALDMEIVVSRLDGTELGRRAFRGGGQPCPAFVEGPAEGLEPPVVLSGPDPRAVRAWLATFPPP